MAIGLWGKHKGVNSTHTARKQRRQKKSRHFNPLQRCHQTTYRPSSTTSSCTCRQHHSAEQLFNSQASGGQSPTPQHSCTTEILSRLEEDNVYKMSTAQYIVYLHVHSKYFKIYNSSLKRILYPYQGNIE